MNIFALDESPYLAATYHCDRHVVKMILETAQLLSTAHHVIDGDESPLKDFLYKPTHMNHPSAIWVRETSDNYFWTVDLFKCLHYEWQKRWNHSHDHKSYIRMMHHDGDMRTLQRAPRGIAIGPRTAFSMCMPEKYKNPADPVQSYRDYYVGEKARLLKFTKRGPPFWLRDVEDRLGHDNALLMG